MQRTTAHRGLIVAGLCLWSAAGAGGQDLDDNQLKRELAQLPRQYAEAKGDFPAQMEVARRAAELGETARKRMLRPVTRDQQNAFRSYASAYQRAAQAADEPQAKDLIENQNLRPLRDTVLHYSRMAHLLSEEAGEFDASSAAEQLRTFEEETALQVRNAKAMLTLGPQEVVAIQATNAERMRHGLPPLEVDPRLCLTAADHSADMERLNFFAHESPVPGKQSFSDRARRFQVAASAENIAKTGQGGRHAVQLWMESDGHRRNILNPEARRIGVGRSGAHYTQLFGR